MGYDLYLVSRSTRSSNMSEPLARTLKGESDVIYDKAYRR